MYIYMYVCKYVYIHIYIDYVKKYWNSYKPADANTSARIGYTSRYDWGYYCPSIDLNALKNSRVFVHRSTFEWVSCGFLQKRPRNCSIPPKLSVANSLDNDGKLDRYLIELWVFCGLLNKRDLWKTMHRQTKCCKLSRSTDSNDPDYNSMRVENYFWKSGNLWSRKS